MIWKRVSNRSVISTDTFDKIDFRNWSRGSLCRIPCLCTKWTGSEVSGAKETVTQSLTSLFRSSMIYWKWQPVKSVSLPKKPNSQSIWHYIILKRTCFLFFSYGRIFKTFLRGTAKENINWIDKFSSCGWKLKIYRRFLFLFCLKKRIQDKSILDNFVIY